MRLQSLTLALLAPLAMAAAPAEDAADATVPKGETRRPYVEYIANLPLNSSFKVNGQAATLGYRYRLIQVANFPFWAEPDAEPFVIYDITGGPESARAIDKEQQERIKVLLADDPFSRFSFNPVKYAWGLWMACFVVVALLLFRLAVALPKLRGKKPVKTGNPADPFGIDKDIDLGPDSFDEKIAARLAELEREKAAAVASVTAAAPPRVLTTTGPRGFGKRLS